jgi:hypothetical protein
LWNTSVGSLKPRWYELARVEVVDRSALERQRGEQFLPALLTEHLHELFVDVEVVFDRGLARAGDEEDPP